MDDWKFILSLSILQSVLGLLKQSSSTFDISLGSFEIRSGVFDSLTLGSASASTTSIFLRFETGLTQWWTLPELQALFIQVLYPNFFWGDFEEQSDDSAAWLFWQPLSFAFIDLRTLCNVLDCCSHFLAGWQSADDTPESISIGFSELVVTSNGLKGGWEHLSECLFTSNFCLSTFVVTFCPSSCSGP